ncbi:lysine/cadaverine antiporter [Candidatus Francisella endociliophora]|uniref:Lysine/cadaverine antiporter n=1 Tax=Candidatus Francisella endociliophora TaxID=653937 RepID=A0A097EQU3_9GAMM|nr:amino acid permease [Francisella sp. FSC1006]AIT09939.1 lysine/cadaverine antiporter [Francisella sp. FSC1006]
MHTKSKKLGIFASSAIVAGNMMGSGIALLPSNLAAIGSLTFISWIIASIGAIGLAFVFAKLSATDPQEGGPVAYAGEVAPILGFQSGVLYFNANWIGNLAIAITGVAYLSTFFPELNNPIYAGIATIIIIWIFTAINFFGASWVGRLVSIGVVLLLIPIILTATVGWFFFSSETFINNWNVTHSSNIHGIFSGVLLCVWSFIGVESASVNTNLVKNPRKTIPLATIIGVSIAAIVYFLSCTVISGIFKSDVVAHSGAPFSLVSSFMFGNWAGKAVSIIVAFACLASLSSWMMLTAQAGARASHDGSLPKIFGELNKNDIPVKGLIVTSSGMTLLMLVVMLGSGSTAALFGKVISIAVMMTILPYFYSALNLIDVVEHPVKHFVLTVVAIVAILFCFIAYIGAEDYALVSVTIISLITMIFYVRKDREDFEKRVYKDVHHWQIKGD